MGNRRKKYISLLLLLAVEMSFLVFALRAVARPLRPDGFPCSKQIVAAPAGLTRHVNLETPDDWPRLLGQNANLQPTRFQPIEVGTQLRSAPKREVDIDCAVPLIQFLSRLKIPASNSDDPSLIG